MARSELETLLGYAQRLLKKVRGPIGPEEFGSYITSIEKDMAALSNPGKVARIRPALESVKGCGYVLRNEPDRRSEMVVAQVQKLIYSIKEEMR